MDFTGSDGSRRTLSIKPPTKQTLKKYGLSLEEWQMMNDGLCHLCRDAPPSGRLFIDHEHIPRWRHKKPEERRRHVRGLVCFTCNTRRIARNNYETVGWLAVYFENHRRRLWKDKAA